MLAVINACGNGELDASPVVVISNNRDAGALEIARNHSIPAQHISQLTEPDPAKLDNKIADTLSNFQVDLVILAGYMKKIGPITLKRFRHRILNIHPSLLPEFGGPGMYGMHVHEAVIAAAAKTSGATVHLVEGDYDVGRILCQEQVPVYTGDSPESLAARVLEVEHRLYVETLKKVISGEIQLADV